MSGCDNGDRIMGKQMMQCLPLQTTNHVTLFRKEQGRQPFRNK